MTRQNYNFRVSVDGHEQEHYATCDELPWLRCYSRSKRKALQRIELVMKSIVLEKLLDSEGGAG